MYSLKMCWLPRQTGVSPRRALFEGLDAHEVVRPRLVGIHCAQRALGTVRVDGVADPHCCGEDEHWVGKLGAMRVFQAERGARLRKLGAEEVDFG